MSSPQWINDFRVWDPSFQGLLSFGLSNTTLLFLYVTLGLQVNSVFSEQTPHFIILCLSLCSFSLMGLHFYPPRFWPVLNICLFINEYEYVYEEIITTEFVLNSRHFQTYEFIYFNNSGRQVLLDSKLPGGRDLCLDHCSVPSAWHKVVQNKCFEWIFYKRGIKTG